MFIEGVLGKGFSPVGAACRSVRPRSWPCRSYGAWIVSPQAGSIHMALLTELTHSSPFDLLGPNPPAEIDAAAHHARIRAGSVHQDRVERRGCGQGMTRSFLDRSRMAGFRVAFIPNSFPLASALSPIGWERGIRREMGI